MCHFWAIFVQDKCNNKFLKFLGFFQNSPFMLKTSVSSKNAAFSSENGLFVSKNPVISTKNSFFSKVVGFSSKNSVFFDRKCWIFEKNTSFPAKIIPFWRMILRKSSFKIKSNFSNFQKFWIGLDFLPIGNLVFSDFRFSDIFIENFVSGLFRKAFRILSWFFFRTFSDISTDFQIEIISRQKALS